MRTTQAVIAIGGRAQRLRAAGLQVCVSKSFIRIKGQPLLYWNLMSLYAAGVRRLVLCGDEKLQLVEAEFVLSGLGVKFEEVEYHQDPGLGVHGLPYQAREFLDTRFIFECGHSLMRPEHYRALDGIKTTDNVVFSAFTPHPKNLRQPVSLERDAVRLLNEDDANGYALAHPLVADLTYVEMLPRLNFSVREVIAYYAERSRLQYHHSEMPPEFDILEEYKEATSLYDNYVEQHGLLDSDAYIQRYGSH